MKTRWRELMNGVLTEKINIRKCNGRKNELRNCRVYGTRVVGTFILECRTRREKSEEIENELERTAV